MYEKGDLLQHRRTSKLYEVVRGMYTARFMEQQDYEMVEGGMGHLAGVYGGAIDVVDLEGPDQGTKRIKQRMRNFVRVVAQ